MNLSLQKTQIFTRLLTIKHRHLGRLKKQIWVQRRIFIFGAIGYFKLGALLEGSRGLMSYKLALHVLAIFVNKLFQFMSILLYSDFSQYEEQKQS